LKYAVGHLVAQSVTWLATDVTDEVWFAPPQMHQKRLQNC
jgi:hypothetical protein